MVHKKKSFDKKEICLGWGIFFFLFLFELALKREEVESGSFSQTGISLMEGQVGSFFFFFKALFGSLMDSSGLTF